MHVRTTTQRNRDGSERLYCQIVESYRREDGVPASRVLLHLGPRSPLFISNLKAALAASKQGVALTTASSDGVVHFSRGLSYLPMALVCRTFRDFGLERMLDEMCPATGAGSPVSKMVQVLVAQRCIAPDSKLSLQRWLPSTAVEHIIGTSLDRFNNTRVHRAMSLLDQLDDRLQDAIADKLTGVAAPRILYLDLTDTWFDAGGGSLSRRGQTKAGHRSKRKIHIALMVDEQGMPLRWQLMPGALSETTVLPKWVPMLRERQCYRNSILVFDRGLPSVANFHHMIHDDQRFLTSIKSDSIATYVQLDSDTLDEMQALGDRLSAKELSDFSTRLELNCLNSQTYARALGLVQPPAPKTKRCVALPAMQMYLYFNPEIRLTKRTLRAEKEAKVKNFVDELNMQLSGAKQPRKRDPILHQVKSMLEKHKLMEMYEVRMHPLGVKGCTKLIDSWQVELVCNEQAARNTRRYDGLSLLVAHPNVDLTLEQAVKDYRNKNRVEADFRTIKSVLKLRPTFHRTDPKIKSHVTICVLGLLIERLLERQLQHATAATTQPLPRTAAALLEELDAVRIAAVRIGSQQHLLRNEASERVMRLLLTVGAGDILEQFPSHTNIASAQA